jgi:hypothetical protein
MLTFLEWVEQHQMMMFSTRPREVYHGSNTGTNFATLRSFQQGIRANIAQGYGQGAGFYVWSDKKSAVKHAMGLAQGNMMVTAADTTGFPMLVTVEAMLTPEEWDLDYEISRNPVLMWIHSNWETLKNKLGGILDIDRSKKLDTGMGFVRAGETKRKAFAFGGSSTTGMGELLGQVFNHLQQNDPNITRPFEELFFANMPAGAAIKYVGQRPLSPKKIEVLQNNQWIDARQLQGQQQPPQQSPNLVPQYTSG